MMIVGIMDVHLRLTSARSLKDKRQIIKSLLARLRSRFGVAAAEIDFNDVWQRARLGIACVAGTEFQARKIMKAIARDIEASQEAEVIEITAEFISPGEN